MNHQDRDPEELLSLLRQKEGKLQKTMKELSYLKSIVQNTEDAIIGIDLEGTIISWNPGAEKIHGYTASEAVGNSVSMLIPPYNTNEISLILAWIKNGERIGINIAIAGAEIKENNIASRNVLSVLVKPQTNNPDINPDKASI